MNHRRAVLAALTVATLLLTVAAYGEGTLPGDVAVSRFVQRLDGGVAAELDRIGYWIGGLWPIVGVGAVLTLLLALGRQYAEAVVMAGIVLSRALNPLLKWLIQSPRPTTEDVRVTEIATNYGFPSGHVMGAVLVYGTGTYVAQVIVEQDWLRRLAQALCLVAILITSFARVHSGAHWFTDVIGGYLWGALILLSLFWLAEAVQRREPAEVREADRALPIAGKDRC